MFSVQMPRVFLLLLIIGLGLTWVAPNHHLPWTAFHVDAWISIILLLVAIWIAFRTTQVDWHCITLMVGGLSILPWVQYFQGDEMLHIQNAWLVFLYIFGFFLSILFSAQWERIEKDGPLNLLFIAIVGACVVSVFFQLNQWLDLVECELLCLGKSSRPFGNLGQPNQMATLLLWGVLAVGWLFAKKKINGWIAVLLCSGFLFGVALTFSRTAWIGVILIFIASIIWRKYFRAIVPVWVSTSLFLYFFLCVFFISTWFSYEDFDTVSRTSSELRPIAWRMFIEAVLQKPWFGYGWNQAVSANVSAAITNPQLPSAFTYSHNLWIDLVLWCGVPIGSGIFLGLCWWLYRQIKKVNCVEDALIILALLIIGNHAMLELPLYYAYFLFPVGFMVGVLCVRLQNKVIFQSSRFVFFPLLVGAAFLLGILIRDYLRVETSYNLLRMELDRFTITSPRVPPDVVILPLWHDYILYARTEPNENMSVEQLEWMRKTVTLFPGALFIHKFVTALAMNHQQEEANLWIGRMKKMTSDADYLTAQKMWKRQGERNNSIKAIDWPS